MKTYFESKGFKVQDNKDIEFAKFTVTNTNRCFDDVNEAVLYCIGKSEGCCNDSNLMAYVRTFKTMIKQ